MPAHIECRGLTKWFSSKENTHVLRHLNLSIDKGDIFGVIGLSGAGKSTFLRCLARLEKPSLGQILVSGENIATLEGQALQNYRRRIGVIFQQFHLFNGLTVKKNISYPLEVAKIPSEEQERRVWELLALVDLKDKANSYPMMLSGGQKQRVGIARALANYPEILLCDEATSALDPKTTKEILTLLKEIHQRLGLTIVLITHEMDVIKTMCNKVAVLNQGEMIEEGSVIDLFIDPKHSITKELVFRSLGEVPAYLEKGRLLHLYFRGEKAEKPIITHLIKHFDVEANILMGWIDRLQQTMVGNLILQLSGERSQVEKAIIYLKDSDVIVGEIEHAGQ